MFNTIIILLLLNIQVTFSFKGISNQWKTENRKEYRNNQHQTPKDIFNVVVGIIIHVFAYTMK